MRDWSLVRRGSATPHKLRIAARVISNELHTVRGLYGYRRMTRWLARRYGIVLPE